MDRSSWPLISWNFG